MNRAMFSIVVSALIGHSGIAEIVNETMTPQDFDRLYRAAVDISMTCYGDPGNAVGIIGDTDGSILERLRLNHFIPVVLVNGRINNDWNSARSHKLQVFIIAVNSPMHLYNVLWDLKQYIWWNEDANFLIVDTRPELRMQCVQSEDYINFTTLFGILNVQFICRYRQQQSESIMIWNSNPFMHQAPEVWKFRREYNLGTTEGERNGYLFTRLYRERGQSCESINFAKTGNVGGYPLNFITSPMPPELFEHDSELYEDLLKDQEDFDKILFKWFIEDSLWFIDNIVFGMNATAVMIEIRDDPSPVSVESGISLLALRFSTCLEDLEHTDDMILRLKPIPVLAVSQHTPHMSQLHKILSVIDGESRIGMWVVYLITFLFFKFFLGQSVIPALLNLVRLTCGTGLTTLPQNVAPTIYLSSLLMFVVTLQAIYTGNLATLLTTTISYPNVQTKEHIPKLGYKIYSGKNDHISLSADPILDGCIVEIPNSEDCIDYLLRDPLGVCVMNQGLAIYYAITNKLHLIKDPMLNDYMIYKTTKLSLLQGRIQDILTILFEAGLYHYDPALDNFMLEFVDDDEVKKNVERRVMTFEDLSFTFVILGVGLLCSFICFIGEILICRIQLKYAERRNRVRGRSAWEVTATKCSWFPSLNCRFSLRHLFANRR